MDPLSIIASVSGILGLAATSTKNLITLLEKVRGAPAVIRRTSRDAAEYMAVVKNLESWMVDEELGGDQTVRDVLHSLEAPLRASQDAIDELLEVVEIYIESKSAKLTGLKWAFKDEEKVKVLNERLGMCKTTLHFALTTMNTLNQMRINRTQELISDQIRDLRLDLDLREVSTRRGRKGSDLVGTEIGFALQRFLNDTNTEVVDSPLEVGHDWADCSEALTSGEKIPSDDGSKMIDNVLRPPRSRLRSETLWLQLETCNDINAVDPQQGSLLHQAARLGDLELAQILLYRNADINVRDRQGSSPLGVAIFYSQHAVARFLIAQGADIHIIDDDKHTLCHKASQNDNITMLKILLEQGVDKNALEVDEWTPLYLAADSGSYRACKFLIEAGVQTDIKAIDGSICLHPASSKGFLDIVELLLNNGVDVNATEKDGNTAMHLAILNHVKPVVSLLLKYGAAVNLQNSMTRSAFQLAVEFKWVEVVKILLDGGADIHLKDDWGDTPLHDAAELADTELLLLLIAKGSQCEVLNNAGETVFWKAMRSRKASTEDNIAILGVLADNGANLEARETSFQKSPLIVSAEEGNLEIVNFLIERKADLHAQDCFGMTGLHYGAEYCKNIDCVKALAEAGSNIDMRNNSNETPLWKAYNPYMEDMKLEVIEYLISMGASDSVNVLLQLEQFSRAKDSIEAGMPIDFPWSDGKVAIHFACRNGAIDILKLLLDRGTDVNCTDDMGSTPLICAIQNESIETARFLLENGADVKHWGKTSPLILAAESDNLDLVRLLLSYGVDVEAVCGGRTALSVCCRPDHENVEIFKTLVQHGANVDEPKGDMGILVRSLAELNECDGILRWLAVWDLENKTRKERAGNEALNERRFGRKGFVGNEMKERPTW